MSKYLSIFCILLLLGAGCTKVTPVSTPVVFLPIPEVAKAVEAPAVTQAPAPVVMVVAKAAPKSKAKAHRVKAKTHTDAECQGNRACAHRGGGPWLGEGFPECLRGHCWLPNGMRLSCGVRRPQSRESRTLSSGRRAPTASSAG